MTSEVEAIIKTGQSGESYLTLLLSLPAKTNNIATSEVKRPRIEVKIAHTDPRVEANVRAKFHLCGLSGLGGDVELPHKHRNPYLYRMRKLSTAATTAILPKLSKMFFPIRNFHFVFFRILLYQKLTKMEFHIGMRTLSAAATTAILPKLPIVGSIGSQGCLVHILFPNCKSCILEITRRTARIEKRIYEIPFSSIYRRDGPYCETRDPRSASVLTL